MAGSDDEFDKLFDDAFDDESLAQAELMATQQPRASASKGQSLSQRQEQQKQRSAPESFRPISRRDDATSSRMSRPSGPSLSPPTKKQRLSSTSNGSGQSPAKAAYYNHGDGDDDDEETPEIIWADGGYVTRPASQRRTTGPGPDDFEVHHRGPGQPPALGTGHGRALNEDRWEAEDWGAVDDEEFQRAEEQAWMSSQATQAQQSRSDGQEHFAGPVKRLGLPRQQSRIPPPHRHANGTKQPSPLASSKPMDAPVKPPVFQNGNGPASDETALESLRKQMQEMAAQLEAARNEANLSRQQMYTRAGEVKMVRERNEKAERDLAEALASIAKQREEHRKILEEKEKTFKEEKERMDTNAAFHRLENETSVKRAAWPGSVRRRMPPRGVSGTQSFSQAPFAPPPVMPTTPTRRNKDTSRSPASGRSGSRNLRDLDGLEESPSKRKARQQPQAWEEPSRLPLKPPSTTQRRAAFPGFDNSFAAVTAPSQPPKQTTPRPQTQPPPPNDVDMAELSPQKPLPEPLGEFALQGGQTATYEATRRNMYFWAVSAYTRRKTALTATLLGHVSPCPLAPLSLPASRYLLNQVAAPTVLSHRQATVQRLLDASLPEGCHPAAMERQRYATELLAVTMADGANASDAERRFAFLLLPLDEGFPKDEETMMAARETDFYDCQEIMDESMEELYDPLARSLRGLMAVYVRVCAVDAVQDVFALMSALATFEPSIINHLVGDEYEEEDVAPSQPSGVVLATTAPPFHNRVGACMVECVRKAGGILPLSVSSPDSVVTATESTQAGPPMTQGRWARERAKREQEANVAQPWDMGAEQRGDLLESVSHLLAIFSWHMGDQCGRYFRDDFETPGFIPTLLNVRGRSSTTQGFLSVLIQLAQYKDFWKSLVACSFDPAIPTNMPSRVTKSRAPLFELLSKSLVDSRQVPSQQDAHVFHSRIITLLSQLVIKHPDAMTMAKESKSLFAALIQCIHEGTSLIWNEDRPPAGRGGVTIIENTISHLIMDIRLLAHIFTNPDQPQDLFHRLNRPDAHALLNGIRHCFVLSLSRLSFCDEPHWVPDVCVKELHGSGVAELALELLEMVLSPDEVDGVWAECGVDEEEEEAEEMAVAENHEDLGQGEMHNEAEERRSSGGGEGAGGEAEEDEEEEEEEEDVLMV